MTSQYTNTDPLESIVADIIADARSIDIGFAADEPQKYQLALDEGVNAINNYIKSRVQQVLSQLKAPENLLYAHKTYSKLSKLSSQLERHGKTYDSCLVCGFSPEAMNDQIDRIAELNQVKGEKDGN